MRDVVSEAILFIKVGMSESGKVRLFKIELHGRGQAGMEDHGCFGEVKWFGMFGHRLFGGRNRKSRPDMVIVSETLNFLLIRCIGIIVLPDLHFVNIWSASD